MPDAAAVIAALRLRAHPEGGWFTETWRAPSIAGARPTSSAILYLLATDGTGAVERHHLGADLVAGEEPQVVVPANAWQAARPLGAWTLVGCIVAPAFEFDGFELAPPDWAPAP
jgi:predicted cupin superfamily sugar epimerase